MHGLILLNITITLVHTGLTEGEHPMNLSVTTRLNTKPWSKLIDHNTDVFFMPAIIIKLMSIPPPLPSATYYTQGYY